MSFWLFSPLLPKCTLPNKHVFLSPHPHSQSLTLSSLRLYSQTVTPILIPITNFQQFVHWLVLKEVGSMLMLIKLCASHVVPGLVLFLATSWTPSEVESAGEAFAKQLDVGYNVSCPSRGKSCPQSLTQFPPTP